jgi:hypothetical protein
MDLNRLTMGDRVIAISGIVLFIASFFNWLGAKVDQGPFEVCDAKSGWGFTLTLIAILIGIAMVVLVALKAFDVKLPEMSGQLTWGTILLIMGVVAFVFVLIKLIAGPNLGDADDIPGVEKTREIGIFIGLIATAGLAVGGYLRFQEDKGASTATPPTAPPPTA